ncbi:glycoside hydrolase family protein [Aerococcaceae bacterium NML191219]|nr:glycoside hydrolase family protein [Aerococcaceae bacterium NML191219]
MVNSNMKISTKGISLVREFEGLRLNAYRDPVGIWTIGYGHTKGVYPGMTITEEQANHFLNEDLKTHASGIFRYIKVKLNQNQFDALVSFHFNLGANILQGSTLLTYINNQQWQAAAEEMKLYNRAGGQVLAGLRRRRQAEAELFLSQTPVRTSPVKSRQQYYTVVSGDSLWRIAQLHRITVDELVQLNGFSSSNVVIHPGQKLIVKKGSSAGQSSTPEKVTTPPPSKIDKMIKWFRDRIGVTGYSQDLTLRQGPHYYDCSSAVYAALIEAGFLPKGTWLGGTSDLYRLEGNLFSRITRSEAKRGDIFIVGDHPGTHTGVFVSNTHIVHSVNEKHGMKETLLDGWVGEGPIYCFRLHGTNANTSQPATSGPVPDSDERVNKQYKESGKFTANRSVAIRNEPKESATVVNTLDAGESVTYDMVYITNKFVYISYISYSGIRRYVAVRTYSRGQRGPLWGTIV